MDIAAFGRPVSSHKGTFAGAGWLWYIGGILVVAAVLNLTKGQVALAAGSFVSGAAVLAFAMLRLRQTVEVYERGLVWNQVWKTVYVRAEEVRSATLVHNYRRSGYFLEVRIAQTRGGEVSIKGVTEAERLCAQAAAWGRSLGAPTAQTGPGAAIQGHWAPPGAR